jgi:putative flavoprotein involved in K+ transport
MREEVRHHGGPLIRVKRSHLAAAGVHHTPARVVGVRDGRPELADGTVLDVSSIVWCTGFGLDLHWAQVPLGDGDYPSQHRGVVEGAAGLYVVGLPFLRGFTSMLVGGVGRDADFVATHIAKRGTAARLPRQARPAEDRATR